MGEQQGLAPWQPCAILLDYDDTLLPTEALLADCEEVPLLDKLTPEFREALQEVDIAVHKLLLHAVNLCTQWGTVHIVTAASTEWIKLTLPSLLPRAASAVRDHGISITASTNSMSSPGPWHKARAFHHALRRLPKGVKRVLSVGDGLQERVALHFVAEQQVWEPGVRDGKGGHEPGHPSFKSLRLRQMPTIDSLLQELRFLRESAMEDLLRGNESVGRGDVGSAADLYVDPLKLHMRVHSEDDRALLWAMVDAMKADWERQSSGVPRQPAQQQWPAPVPPKQRASGEQAAQAAEAGAAADSLRQLPLGIAWPFASWRNHGLICTMCTRDDGADVEYVEQGRDGQQQGNFDDEGQFQQSQNLDDLEASEGGQGVAPYRTPRGPRDWASAANTGSP
jgi:hypothetical protein